MKHSIYICILLGLFLACKDIKADGRVGETQAPQAEQAQQEHEAQQPPVGTDFDLQRAIYTAVDSSLVVTLLNTDTAGVAAPLFYARKFRGVPYVAATLEKADPERLIVHLRELDCTTLVETACALALTKRQGSARFEDYCQNLERLRYRHGKMNGYLSRLHYFAWWMHDNIEKGTVKETTNRALCTTPITVNDFYMSQHPEKYEMLRRHPEWVDSICTMEKSSNGRDGYFLPEEKTLLSKRELSFIKDGDIIAIVTTKAGLDYSHLGFAEWGSDGKLHLLNASSIHHKVVSEPKTLRQYLREHRTSVGIRVLRLL